MSRHRAVEIPSWDLDWWGVVRALSIVVAFVGFGVGAIADPADEAWTIWVEEPKPKPPPLRRAPPGVRFLRRCDLAYDTGQKRCWLVCGDRVVMTFDSCDPLGEPNEDRAP
jgi:hypothetical protein